MTISPSSSCWAKGGQASGGYKGWVYPTHQPHVPIKPETGHRRLATVHARGPTVWRDFFCDMIPGPRTQSR